MSVNKPTVLAPASESAKLPGYSVRVENYMPDNDTESWLMLGLSHKDIHSAHRRTQWMYENNPAGRAVICTIRHNESEKEIGMLALSKRQIKTRSGIHSSGIFCDLVTDRSHRTLGPAIKLMQEALNNAKSHSLRRIYGWPNEKSVVLFKRLPSAKLGRVDIYRRYFNWSSIFSDHLPRLPAQVLGAVFKFADNTLQWVLEQVNRQLYQVREISEFDQHFDALWSTASERYEEIGVRNAEFLNWRFCQNTEDDHRILAIYSRKTKKLTGYIVYRELNETSVEISDFLAIDSRFAERALLRASSSYIRNKGYQKISVHFTGNSSTARNLWTCGFIKVGSQTSVHFHFSDGDDLVKPPHTHVTQADHDVG
ncbi:MAG: hypothetical protein AB8B84_10625 [Granulosicoccus sp.]